MSVDYGYYKLGTINGVYEFRPGKYGLEVWCLHSEPNGSSVRSMVIPWSALEKPPKTKAELAEECVNKVLEYHQQCVGKYGSYQDNSYSFAVFDEVKDLAFAWKDAPE